MCMQSDAADRYLELIWNFHCVTQAPISIDSARLKFCDLYIIMLIYSRLSVVRKRQALVNRLLQSSQNMERWHHKGYTDYRIGWHTSESSIYNFNCNCHQRPTVLAYISSRAAISDIIIICHILQKGKQFQPYTSQSAQLEREI